MDTIKKFLFFIFFLMLPTFIPNIFSQPLPPTPQPIPIDGYLLGLIVAGFVFAIRKFYRRYDRKIQ